LIELMLVVAIIAIATGVASLALRDPTAAKLEQEAVRLAALLESARAEARSSGVPAAGSRWRSRPTAATSASSASPPRTRFRPAFSSPAPPRR
jgi:general secretion pathway protein H